LPIESLFEEEAMPDQLPKVIATYLAAYNARDRKVAVDCFLEAAAVHDEGRIHHGRKAIGEWFDETIGKYQPVLGVGTIEEDDKEITVAVTVSGSFPGSPVQLHFRFSRKNGKIAELVIAP
jgi:hypothetical protein